MNSTNIEVGGLRTVLVENPGTPRLPVVLLHGYAMHPSDLAPFVESMGVPGTFYLPEGPVKAEPSGRAWWPIDQERRNLEMAAGPRDLWQAHPPGAAAARAHFASLLHQVCARHGGASPVVIGFSQGGMLACDTLLRDGGPMSALALLSASRISLDEWLPRAERLAGMPVLVSHGRQDPDLAFAAGEALRDFCARSGALVTWVPFEGGHEIPLVAWRAVRRLLQEHSRAS